MIEFEIDHSENLHYKVTISDVDNYIVVNIYCYNLNNLLIDWCRRWYYNNELYLGGIIADPILESKIDNLINKYFELRVFT